MNFREAMSEIERGNTVKVIPANIPEGRSYLIRVDFHPDLGQECLQCVRLTKDGQHISPGSVWEPVCYLLCFDDYLDGEWEVVDADDYIYRV